MARALKPPGTAALEALREVSARMISSLDLEETLAGVAKAILEVAECDIGAVWLLDETAGKIRLRATAGERAPEWKSIVLATDLGVNAVTIRSGGVQRVDDYWELPQEQQVKSPIIQNEPVRSMLVAPVFRRGRAIGTLAAHRRRVDPFTPESEATIQVLAGQAGIALDNALTYSELEAAHARLQLAIEAAADLSASLDPGEVIRRAIRRAVEAVGSDRGVLLRVDGGETVVEDFFDVAGGPDFIGYRHPIAFQPLMQQAISTRRPVLGGRFDLSRLAAPLDSALAEVSHTATLPLILDGEVVAVLVLSRRQDAAYLETDLSLLGLIGNQAVLALRNAQLFEHSRQVGRAQTDFLNLAAHELRTPLSVIAGYVSMLQEGTFGSVPEGMQRPLAVIHGKSGELEVLVGELLTASRLEADTVRVQPVAFDLSRAAADAVERARSRGTLVGARLLLKSPRRSVHAAADPGHVATILDNLVNNALSYSPEPPWVQVTVSGGTQPRVAVADHGYGIPGGALERIFERFFRVDDPNLRHIPGTGLGLPISRELAQRMGGSLRLEQSRPGKGSVFVLRLPRA